MHVEARYRHVPAPTFNHETIVDADWQIPAD